MDFIDRVGVITLGFLALAIPVLIVRIAGQFLFGW